jgi:hypothetical protein
VDKSAALATAGFLGDRFARGFGAGAGVDSVVDCFFVTERFSVAVDRFLTGFSADFSSDIAAKLTSRKCSV